MKANDPIKRCRNSSAGIKKRSVSDREILRTQKSSDRFRIKLALRDLNSRMQSFRRVIRRDRHLALRDDLAAVDSRVDVMDRAARYFLPSGQSLGPCFHARKFRQQRRMKINDSSRICGKDLLFQNAHKTGEHHQFHARVLEQSHYFHLHLWLESRAELSRRKINIRHAELPRDI